MAIKISGSTIIDDSRGLVNVGISTFTENVNIASDSKKLLAGAGSEMEVFHDGTNSVIKDTRDSGKVRIQADNFDFIDKDSTQTLISATVSDGVDLYFNEISLLQIEFLKKQFI